MVKPENIPLFIMILMGLSSRGCRSFYWTSLYSKENFTYIELGKKMTLQWSYVAYKNKFQNSYLTFENSTRFQGVPYNIAYRGTLQEQYKLQGGARPDMKVNGFSNVSLTITNVKLPMNMSVFCCKVNLDTVEKPAIQCTTVFIYVPPKILNHTSKNSVRQGSATSINCSASGTPSPKYYWTKNTAAINYHLVNTSMLTLNITGRESSGNYCCVADNTYARDTKCTSVHVTEYQPINTNITVSKPWLRKGTAFNVTCTADASPSANYTFYQPGKTPYQSTDGFYSTTSISSTTYEYITCLPENEYGQGPKKALSIPILSMPKLLNTTPQFYVMTDGPVNIKCQATGFPAPNIRWLNSTCHVIDINSTYYEVPFQCSDDVNLTFYCVAYNNEGNSTKRRLTVYVNSSNTVNCTTHDKTVPKQDTHIWVIVSVIVIVISEAAIAVCIMIIFLRRQVHRKDNRPKSIEMDDYGSSPQELSVWCPHQPFNSPQEENPYGDPIDAISPSMSESNKTRNKQARGSEDHTYASVFNSRSPRKKANRQPKINTDIYP